MSVELIYHDVSGGGTSELDRNVKELVKNSDARLISPYVGVDYLRNLSELAGSWRLVTDLDEMVSNVRQSTRDKTHRLLADNSEKIRHLRDVHAKAVITDESAVVGSANLTKMGMTDRTEVYVRFDGTEEVEELGNWFETLWDLEEAEKIDDERITEAVDSAARENRKRDRTTDDGNDGRSRGKSPVSKSLHIPEDAGEAPVPEERYDELVERVEKTPSRRWASRFFDLFAELIGFTGLSNSDPRLVSSMPADRDKLAVSVNNRYVLVAYPRTGEVGVTLPRQDGIEKFLDYEFSALSGETEEETPYFYVFPEPDGRLFGFKDVWKDAVLTEMERADASPYAESHASVVYRAAVDSVFRQRILRSAFG